MSHSANFEPDVQDPFNLQDPARFLHLQANGHFSYEPSKRVSGGGGGGGGGGG